MIHHWILQAHSRPSLSTKVMASVMNCRVLNVNISKTSWNYQLSMFGKFNNFKKRLLNFPKFWGIKFRNYNEFFKKKLEDISLFVGPLIPLFWTFDDICPGFQSQCGSPPPHLHTCMLHHLCATESSDSPLVQPKSFSSMYLWTRPGSVVHAAASHTR